MALTRFQPAAAAARRCVSTSAGAVFDCSFMKGKHVDTLAHFSPSELRTLLRLSHALKDVMGRQGVVYRPLVGRTMSMIFAKRSTRTRVSTEAGVAQLGGHAIFLSSDDIQLGKNESMRDTARVLSRFNDVVLARVHGHAEIEELCREATVPVINALSDMHHPLQGLADLMTLQERYGRVATADGGSLAGLRVAWVGDGNNIVHTLMSTAGKMQFHLRIATPKGYEVDAGLLAAARTEAAAAGVSVDTTHDPLAAVAGADAIITDTWVSMGQEKEAAQRLVDFEGYQVTEAMAKAGGAKPDWSFLHCLPRKPEEVDDDVFYSRSFPGRSLVWDEAENRKWTVMAVVLGQLLGRVELPVPAATKMA